MNCPICDKPTNERQWDDYTVPAPCSRECEREAMFRRMCPVDYREVKPELLPRSDLHEQVLSWRMGVRGLLLKGPTRIGKTRAAWALVRRLIQEDWGVIGFRPTSFGRRCSATFAKGAELGLQWIGRLENAAVVFFDDLGKEVWTPRVEESLFAVIDGRTSNRKPIIATTNYSGAQLENNAGHRTGPLVARLREYCDVIDFGKESVRK